MANSGNGIRKIGQEIRREARRQLGGFSGEFRRQLGRGWVGEAQYQARGFGEEFAHQLFGSPHRRRR